MFKLWQKWNEQSKKVLWIITLIGVVAALPLGLLKIEREQSANTVEFVLDYRDLQEIATYQPVYQAYVDEQLVKLRDAGIKTLSVYEGSLKDFALANRLTYYSAKELAALQGSIQPLSSNFTYVVFAGDEEAAALKPIITNEFNRLGVHVEDWSYEGNNGLVIHESVNAAVLKTLDFDPITLDALHEMGFQIVPRFTDMVQPYEPKLAEAQIQTLSEKYGVNRIIFEGPAAKGAADQAETKSLEHFGELLKKYGIGISVIENIKSQQMGIPRLAYMLDYDVTRVISLSPEDSLSISPGTMTDRFMLAVKDRNIRTIFLNAGIKANGNKGILEDSIDNIIKGVAGEEGTIAKLEAAGYKVGIAEGFEYKNPAYVKYLRMVVVVAAVAFIALLVSAFIPSLALLSFLVGIIGSAGLYILNSVLLEQALALAVAISGPTLGVIWMLNRIYARTFGNRRLVGGNNWALGGTPSIQEGMSRWVFPEQPILRRLGLAINWFIVGTCITFISIPLVFALLFHMKYSLVIDQFRGVSLLHLAPIALIAIYALLYEGNSAKGVFARLKALLMKPITLLWVVIAVVVAAIGLYYLSRTGNSGQVSSIELAFRQWLETTVGVRPRFKEFMIGHPAMLLGLFLALRYRASWLFIVVGTLGQLTMVSTFTHLHSPLVISTVRTLLGLGFGLVIGFILIGLWIVAERVWCKWIWPQIKKVSVS